MSLQTTALQTQQRPRLLHVIANQCLAPADTRHVSAHLARHVLASADAFLSSACHCEPVRTLVWQSVLPAEKPSNLALLRANPYALSRIRPKYCSPLRPTAGETDCHVASLLAMTCRRWAGVRGCKNALPVYCWKRPCNRTHAACFCMSLRKRPCNR